VGFDMFIYATLACIEIDREYSNEGNDLTMLNMLNSNKRLIKGINSNFEEK